MKSRHSEKIKQEALRLGFISCGISKADYLEEEAPRLEQWLNRGMNGQMDYMANNFDKRLDPRKLVPGAKSVVSLLYNYYTETKQKDSQAPKISKYAFGEDYHFVIKDKLKDLILFIQEQIGDVHGRCFVDSAPVMDKVWAARGGLGWIGKNANLLSKQVGSFFFIAELIIDLELAYDVPVTDHCGSCTACIDACPTAAITQPYVVDGSKCISYFTIELKEALPYEYQGKFDDWLFGCDVCQDVCPWNRFSKPHQEARFNPNAALQGMNRQEWMELTEDTFNTLFDKSALKRTGYKGLMRNLSFLNSPLP